MYKVCVCVCVCVYIMFTHIQCYKFILYLYEYKEDFIRCVLSPQTVFSLSCNYAKLKITGLFGQKLKKECLEFLGILINLLSFLDPKFYFLFLKH